MARDWLNNTWWEGIQSEIEVVENFRYLGAHLTTSGSCMSKTLDKRLTKAMQQLKKLRHVKASVEMKTRAINTKVYAAGLYGVEAAGIPIAKIAKLTAAVIDVFRSKNNSHNTNMFFSTLTEDDNELDPMVQILTRRVLQLRRACSKVKGNDDKYKKMLKRYAETKDGGPGMA